MKSTSSTLRHRDHKIMTMKRRNHRERHRDLVRCVSVAARPVLGKSFAHMYDPRRSRCNGRSVWQLRSAGRSTGIQRGHNGTKGEHLVSYQISRSRIRDEVFGCLPYDRGTYDYRRGILEESGGAATNGGVPTLNLVQRPGTTHVGCSASS